jgi:hypothetical protein
MMNEENNESPMPLKRKAGRPKKEVKCDQIISLGCTLAEKKFIEIQARDSQLTVSAYLRSSALGAKVIRPSQVIPKEVLNLTAALYQLAATLNQIARKRNTNDELNALERASLQHLSEQVKRVAHDIKTYLK